ncbi:MAG: hypothetical protein ACTSPM_05570 [Candidatus Heimdallarchaeota archaeon]
MKLLKRNYSYLLSMIIFLVILPRLVPANSFINTQVEPSLQYEDITPNQFPFVGQETTYDVIQTTAGIPAATGTLKVYYDRMLDNSSIHGFFDVEVVSLIEYYNESADGSENLETRHLNIDATDTYIIDLFMVHFFSWEGITPTPMWIFPDDVKVNATVKFWNYTTTCKASHSISFNDKSYEVFIFRTNGTLLDMTLMYGFGRHGESDWYGLLFYMSGSFYEPYLGSRMEATFKLTETNVDLIPLDELNRNVILATTISFYSVVLIGTFTYRFKTRRDLIGGEI